MADEVIKNTIMEMHNINTKLAEMSLTSCEMIMEDAQMLMRAYEMIAIGCTDIPMEELKRQLISLIFERVGHDKFKMWTDKAGQSKRNWDFLKVRVGKDDTAH